jgi:hypothetical protein
MQADDLPGERRAASAKARGSSVALEAALGVLNLLDPVKLAALVVLGPPLLVVGAVQANKVYAADYQLSYETCMAPVQTAMPDPAETAFTLPEPDAHWMVRR